MFDSILLALHIIASTIMNFYVFKLVQRMMGSKNYGSLLIMSISILNGSLTLFSYFYLSIRWAYVLAFVSVYAEMKLLFKARIPTTLYGVMAVMVNIMGTRLAVMSGCALVCGVSLSSVCDTPSLFLGSCALTSVLCLCEVYVLLSKVPMNKLRLAMKYDVQRSFMLVWMSLCAIILFVNLGIFELDIAGYQVKLLELCFSLCLLAGCYLMLAYTFRMNSIFSVLKKNKELSSQLGYQVRLQSALMKDAEFTTQANLSQNSIVSGLEIYSENLEHFKNDYDAWFDYAINRVFIDDRDVFSAALKRSTLLENYEKGIEPKPFEYRRLGNDGEYHWTRLFLRTFCDTENGEVHVFGYGFDVEEEIIQRELLKYKASRDGLTNLLNKTTTEALISEEIKNGCGCLFFIDIDYFKDINDLHGHKIGDRVLRQMAVILRETFRDSDIIGRIGGDEFMVYLKNVVNEEIVAAKAEDLQTRIQAKFSSTDYHPTVSIGIAIMDNELGSSFPEIFDMADMALYSVKRCNKDSYAFFDNSVKPAAARLVQEGASVNEIHSTCTN